ncbi:hypothetical protein ACFE04_026707 [Oxalis oulophora]
MMKLDKKPLISSLQRIKQHKHLFVKLTVSLLLLGIAFRVFIWDSFTSLPIPIQQQQQQQTTDHETSLQLQPPDTIELQPNRTSSQDDVGGRCDLFIGDWIPYPPGSVYTNVTCPEIENHQNCMTNGRPDSEYLYWRWKPRDCDLPRFDPVRFLDSMRNKWWAFIGDSISRNHVQSLLCILYQAEQAVEVYHDKEYKSRIWNFPSYNFTLSVIWAPYLLKSAIFEDINGVSSAAVQLHLDKLDENWSDQFKNFDYVLIAGGKWFLKTAIYYEENKVVGCHDCAGMNLTDLGFDYAYRKALRLALNFITKSDHKAFVFFRTFTPDHFENGEWSTGGTCNRKIPFKDGEIDLADLDTVMREIELEEVEKFAGDHVKLLDTTQLSLLRPDGHPGPYRQFQPYAKDKNATVQYDCLHWCLPGPIDSWNDLVMEMISHDR